MLPYSAGQLITIKHNILILNKTDKIFDYLIDPS